MVEGVDYYTRLMTNLGNTLGPAPAVRFAERQILSLSEVGVSPGCLANWRAALRLYRAAHGLQQDPAAEQQFETASDFLSRVNKTSGPRRYY